MSVEAFQRHHSTNEKNLNFFARLPVLVKVIFCTSARVPSGTNMRRSALSPPRSPEILV